MALTTKEREGIIKSLFNALGVFFPLLNMRDLDGSWMAILPSLESAVYSNFRQASKLAANRYTKDRASVLSAPYTPIIPEITEKKIETIRKSLTVTGPISIKQAMTRGDSLEEAGANAFAALQGAATRHALNGDRETTILNVDRDAGAQGWARIPRSTACAFCAMLATRGGTYRSKESALKVGNKSKHREAGERYHDHCGCTVVPVFTDSWMPPEHVQKFEDMYVQSTTGVYGSKAQQKAFAEALKSARSA